MVLNDMGLMVTWTPRGGGLYSVPVPKPMKPSGKIFQFETSLDYPSLVAKFNELGIKNYYDVGPNPADKDSGFLYGDCRLTEDQVVQVKSGKISIELF